MSTNPNGHLKQRIASDEAMIDSVAADLGDLPQLVKLLNEQLHAITEETERSAYAIMERLQGIDGLTGGLVSTLTARLKETPSTAAAAGGRDAEMLAQLEGAGQALSAMFMEVLAGIQFQDVTRQQIEHVQNALDRLDAHVAQMVEMMRSKDFSHAASIKEHIDQIYATYVMDKQRNVHASVLGEDGGTGEGSAPAQNIELF
jgi:uncharacterized coiled-coil protein SlyX